MRTQAEIVERVNEVAERGDDVFGFERDVLLGYLPLDLLAEFLKEGGREALENDEENPWEDPEFTEEKVKADMVDYLDFAFEKCMGHRGISASRSVSKLTSWAWILELDELVAFAEDDANYPQYGAPVLKECARTLGVPHPDSADFLSMAGGEPCGADYECGCGK